MYIRILLLLPLLLGLSVNGWAAPGECSGPKKDRPDGCDGGETPTVYEAELTMGGFIFGPMDVTPNKKETSYHSNSPLNMDRPPDDPTDGNLDQTAWDGVFSECEPSLLSDRINSVFVGRDDWKIVNTGRNVTENPDSTIRIRFMDVVDVDVDIDFDLFGVRGNHPFLPASGNTSVFILNRAVIFGQDRNLSCRSDNFDLLTPSVLQISRPD